MYFDNLSVFVFIAKHFLYFCKNSYPKKIKKNNKKQSFLLQHTKENEQ